MGHALIAEVMEVWLRVYDKQFFQTIFDQLDEEIWLMERLPSGEYMVSDTNLTSHRNTGLRVDEVMGKTIRELLGDAKAETAHATYEKCLQTREPAVYHESLDFGAQRHWYLTKIVPLPDHDGIQRVADISLDITHRMESDALLHAINKAQLQFIKGTSPNDLFGSLLEDVLELTRSEYGFVAEVLHDDTTGRPYMRMFAVNDRAWNPDMRAFYNQTVDGIKFTNMATLFGAPIVSGQVVISNEPIDESRHSHMPRGHPEIGSFLGVPFIHDGDILGLIGIANRPSGYSTALATFLQPLVTTCVHLILGYQTHEQRQVAESNLRLLNDDLEHRVANRTIELEAANALLRAHDAEKSKFVAVVAHELRQPITILKMELYLLQHGRTTDQPIHMHKMGRQIETLNELVENILDLSRLDLGQPATFTFFDLNDVVQSVVDAYRSLAHDAGLDMTIELAADLPAMFGVSNQIAQVVTNLVVNAVRYTPSGSVDISTCFLADTHRLQLCVSDTGMGIDPADLPRLFERFFRGKQHGTKPHITGNGLGLAIVKEIVDVHQGSIEVQTTVGQGTTFRLSFPVPRIDPTADETPPDQDYSGSQVA